MRLKSQILSTSTTLLIILFSLYRQSVIVHYQLNKSSKKKINADEMAELIPDLLTPEMGECTSREITQKRKA